MENLQPLEQQRTIQELIQQKSLFRRVVARISQVMVVISCITLAAMMFWSVIDVAGRYFFKHPLQGTFEFVGLGLVVCGSLALGYTQLIKGHIRIDVISGHLSPRGQAGLYIFSYTMCLVGAALVMWQGSTRMVDYFFKTVGGKTVTLGWPIWPFMLVMVIGFFWIFFLFIIDIYDCFVEVLKR